MKEQPRKQKLFDLAVPFFLPLWRRVLAATVPILWAFFEFSTANYFWGLIFLGLGGIAAFKFVTADWAAVAVQAEKEKRGD